jgi:ABC-type lipoprotein export system ATPase subunit
MQSITIEHAVGVATLPSRRVLETAAMFGLGIDDTDTATIVPRTSIPLPPGGVVFVTGASGSGKSTMLRLIGEGAAANGRVAIIVPGAGASITTADSRGPLHIQPIPDVPLIDAFNLPLEEAAALLALVGLGDAFVMLRRPAELSDGQRHRLRLAQAIHAAQRHSTMQPSPAHGALILADEFAAALDRPSARSAAGALARWVRRTGHTLVAATTHDDLLEAFDPDVLIVKPIGAAPEIVVKPAADPAPDGRRLRRPPRHRSAPAVAGPPAASRGTWSGCALPAQPACSIEPGTMADYRALAAHHYRAHHVGVATSVFRVAHHAPTVVGRYLARRDQSQVVGVLVRALPRPACGPRDRATGGRYTGLPPRERALVINREVRTIARVVIDPAWRGLSLATSLVRHALGRPEEGVCFTEALAAMGRVNPFFERAGMTRYDVPRRPWDARLLDALAESAIDPPLLASTSAAIAALASLQPPRRAWLLREFRRWFAVSGARRAGQRGSSASLEELLDAARRTLLSRPVYYLAHHPPACA